MKPNSEQQIPNHKLRYAMSKRQRTGMALVGLLVAAFLIWFERIPVKLRWERRPESEDQQKACDIEKYHAKSFHVVNVIDGDTIDIGIPDSNYIFTRIRLLGVDTPETKDPNLPVQYFGPEATDFTTKLALRRQVTVYLDNANRIRDKTKYKRLLAYVQLPDGRFLNEVLLSEGFAYADLRFRHSFFNKYQQLEAGARSLKKGLWKKVTREQLPEWLQREKSKLLN
jgi:endonuclease YncB( thermonuclease family)